MNRSIKVIIALLFSLLFSLNCVFAESVDSIVATINGKPYLKSDLVTLNGKADFNSDILEKFIQFKIIETEANLAKVDATDADIEAYISDVQKGNGLSKEGLIEALKSQGKNWEEYKKEIKLEVIKSKLGGLKFRNSILISDDEVKKTLGLTEDIPKNDEDTSLEAMLPGEGTPIFQLSIPVNDSNKEMQKKELEDKIIPTPTLSWFVGILKSYNQEVSGFLGRINLDDLNDETKEVVSKLDEGEISDVVIINNKIDLYYIPNEEEILVYLKSKNQTERNPDKEMFEQARKSIERKKFAEKVDEYFKTEIYKNYTIEKFLN